MSRIRVRKDRSFKHKAIRAIPWSFAESLSNGLFGLAQTVALAWLFTPSQVGLAAIPISIVAMLETASQLGLVEAVVASRSAHTRVTDTAFTACLVVSTAAAIVCVAASPFIARLFGNQDLIVLTVIAASMLPLKALLVAPTGILMRKMRASRIAVRFTISRAATVAAIICFGILGYGAMAIVLGTVVGWAICVVSVFAGLRRWPRWCFDVPEFQRLMKFGGAISIENLLWNALPRTFALVIGAIHGTTILGFFQMAQRIIDESANLFRAFAVRFGLSVFASYRRMGENPINGYEKASRVSTAIGTPFFIGFSLILPDTIGTILPQHWAPGVIISQMTALAWALAFPRIFISPLLRAEGALGAILFYAFASFGLTMLLAVSTADSSILVVGLAWVSRHILAIPWSVWALKRYFKLSAAQQVEPIWRVFVSCGLMACTVSLTHAMAVDWNGWGRLCSEVGVGAATYLAAIVLLDRKTILIVQSLLVKGRGAPA